METMTTRKINLFIKRIMDFIGSLLGIILLAPFLVTIAMLIKFTSPGPVLLKQERLGKNGEVFQILKFRTMVVNAEKIGDGLFVKTEKDNRITKVGSFLRSTSMDELPQLWNVLVGNMSLVGPRPPVPHHPRKYIEYPEEQRKRFGMKPGMTGLTQVTVRNSVPWDERIKVDIKYIENFSVWLDIKILFGTLRKIFVKESIYTHSNQPRIKKS